LQGLVGAGLLGGLGQRAEFIPQQLLFLHLILEAVAEELAECVVGAQG